MTQRTKLIGLFIMVADDASIPLNSKGEPYVLTSEPDSSIHGYVKFADVEVTYNMPPRTALAEAMRAKLLVNKATIVEENATRLAALDAVIQRLEKGDPA